MAASSHTASNSNFNVKKSVQKHHLDNVKASKMVDHWIATKYASVSYTDNTIAHAIFATTAFIINFLLVVTLAKFGALSVRKEYIVIFSLYVQSNFWRSLQSIR